MRAQEEGSGDLTELRPGPENRNYFDREGGPAGANGTGRGYRRVSLRNCTSSPFCKTVSRVGNPFRIIVYILLFRISANWRRRQIIRLTVSVCTEGSGTAGNGRLRSPPPTSTDGSVQSFTVLVKQSEIHSHG